MLIVFATIAVLGVTTFTIQRLAQNEANQIKTRSIYLAQAGLQAAIYSYRFRDLTESGYFPLGQDNIDANNYFVLGGTEADLLMVNTANSSIGSQTSRMGRVGRRGRGGIRTKTTYYLGGLQIQNATNSKRITIDRMIVSWSGAAPWSYLRRIDIGRKSVWSGASRSPANCDIKDFRLDKKPTIYDVFVLTFGQEDMSNATISINFVMTDGATKNLTVYPASEDYSFTVKSTGKAGGSNIYRTIEADYNAITGKITNYNEIDSEITP